MVEDWNNLFLHYMNEKKIQLNLGMNFVEKKTYKLLADIIS